MNHKNTAYTDGRQEKYYELEEKSWWFTHRAKVFTLIARKCFSAQKPICDIGGSNGFNSLKLQEAGFSTILIEPTKYACEIAQRRGIKTVVNKEFQEYDGIIQQFVCLDVIEHIEDDRKFLREIFSKSDEDVVGIVAVPSFMCLWSSEDDIDGHFRRYSIDEFVEKLEETGYKIIYVSYLFEFLFLPVLIRRHIMEKLHLVKKVYERSKEEEDKVTNSQFLYPKGVVGWLLRKLLNYEYSMVEKNRTIGFGTSLFAVVKKR